jgi:hypothetical protein
METVPSKLAEAKYFPLGDQATRRTVRWWPSSKIAEQDQVLPGFVGKKCVCDLIPFCNQILMLLSPPQEASTVPLGCHETCQTRS